MIKKLDYKNIPTLPCELVDIIADYLDYEKYCKPKHYKLLKRVINDIGDMAAIQSIDEKLLSCYIARECWGINSKSHFGRRVTYTINYNSDLTYSTYLRVNLPQIDRSLSINDV